MVIFFFFRLAVHDRLKPNTNNFYVPVRSLVTATKLKSWQAFMSGSTINQIAQARAIKTVTILKHIVEGIEHYKGPLDQHPILTHWHVLSVPEDHRLQVYTMLDSCGVGRSATQNQIYLESANLTKKKKKKH